MRSFLRRSSDWPGTIESGSTSLPWQCSPGEANGPHSLATEENPKHDVSMLPRNQVWEASGPGAAMSLAMARIRLLAGDAYRLGCRDKSDPSHQAGRELVNQALRDLELVLQGIRDAAAIEHSQRRANDTAAWLRAALLALPRETSDDFAAGWRGAVLRAAEHAFGVGSPEVEALERLSRCG